MVGPEADIIGGTLHHALGELDAVCVVLHNQDTQTEETVRAFASGVYKGRLWVRHAEESGYLQSKYMTAAANWVWQDKLNGAPTMIVPFDADELWSTPAGPVRDRLRRLPAGIRCVAAHLYDYRCTALDRPDPDPFKRMVWRSAEPGPLPKVAVRWDSSLTIDQGNHGILLRGKWMPTAEVPAGLSVSHFQYRSPQHFVRKVLDGAASYAAAERHGINPEWGGHWKAAAQLHSSEGPAALLDLYYEQFYFTDPGAAGLVNDPAPYRPWEV